MLFCVLHLGQSSKHHLYFCIRTKSKVSELITIHCNTCNEYCNTPSCQLQESHVPASMSLWFHCVSQHYPWLHISMLLAPSYNIKQRWKHISAYESYHSFIHHMFQMCMGSAVQISKHMFQCFREHTVPIFRVTELAQAHTRHMFLQNNGTELYFTQYIPYWNKCL